jgi:ADP-ribose pyrophosphatase YjhB (NUDIX family)
LTVPAGDNLARHVCDDCGTIHYQNPKIVVGCIPEWEGRLLLCRRAIEPRYGLWTLPAGFMENGETVQQGAARETLEEAEARVEVGPLYALFDLPHINQVYMLFRAQLRAPEFGPGSESLEVVLMDEDEIPWDALAFPVIKEALSLYLQDRAAGRFPLRAGSIRRLEGAERRYEVTHEDVHRLSGRSGKLDKP